MIIGAEEPTPSRKGRSSGTKNKDAPTWNMFGGLSVNFQGRRRASKERTTPTVELSEGGKAVCRKQTLRKSQDNKNSSRNKGSKNNTDEKNTNSKDEKKKNKKDEKDNSTVKSTTTKSETTTKKRDWKIFGNRGSKRQEEELKVSSDDVNKREESAPPPPPRPKVTPSTARSWDQSQLDYYRQKQRQAVYRAFGGSPLESIRVEQDPEPVLPLFDDHVVVKILASTICLQDCILQRGLDFQVTHPVSLPGVPGHDFVGHIVASGKTAPAFEPGALVGGLVRTGGNARFISVPASSLIEFPKNDMDPEQVVCLITAYATAYECLKQVSSCSSSCSSSSSSSSSANLVLASLVDKNVLIVGGADSVGQALLDLCRIAKAKVHVPAPEHRHASIKSNLKANPLPDKTPVWSELVQGQMDLVFDGVCENGSSASLKCLKQGGSLVCFGQASVLKQKMGLLGAPIGAHLERLQIKLSWNRKVVDTWESYEYDPVAYKKNIETLFQLLKTKKIKPNITHRVGLDEVGLYHDKLEKGEARGIIVCLPSKRLSKQMVFRTNAESYRRINKSESMSSG